MTRDEEREAQERRNILALAGEQEPPGSDEPDAPWWRDAPESTMTVVVGTTPGAVADALGLDLSTMPHRRTDEVPWDAGASPLQVVDAGEGGLGAPLPQEAGLDWEEDPLGTAAELQARITGIRLTRGEVYGAPHPTAVVPWPTD